MHIIWTHGMFDCLHLGHLEMLMFAHEKGDLLYVGIESDTRIRHKYGRKYPIQDEITRKILLDSLWFVDKVVVYDTDYQLECLVKDYKPDMMVFGAKNSGLPIIGSKYCPNVVFFPMLEEYSTTKINEKLSDSL